jgi:hypothetical protein
MLKTRSTALSRVLTILTALLIWKVTLSVLLQYGNYIPPNFSSDFLRGRAEYFWDGYHWAFYAHLISGPPSLILGTMLVSTRLHKLSPIWHRRLVGTMLVSTRLHKLSPIWHRRLGRVQAAGVLLLVVPSGLWMARYAESGVIAGIGLGLLAIATATCVAFGWRAAIMRRFVEHRRWMWRTFILLCSAVILRVIGGLATVADFDAAWLYPVSVWGSWLVPLLVFELGRLLGPRVRACESPS